MTNREFSDYKSDIVLGKRYRDPQTGIEGVATGLHFYQFACERVTLEVRTKQDEIKEYSFDAPRLEEIMEQGEAGEATTKPVRQSDRARTGGPERPGERRL